MNISSVLKSLIEEAIAKNASDIHIVSEYFPSLRINSDLVRLEDFGILTKENVEEIASQLIGEDRIKEFLENKEIDFSFDFEERARFRVNIFFEKGNISCAIRLVPSKIPTIEELSLPSILNDFISYPQGFILVTGPSSQGKSTTLASMLNKINKERAEHIITIEDPIEYVFKNEKSIINQREIGKDSLTFSKALKSVFRQDPDVIMIGEMRDTETISAAITAAETGHLVFATLHTNSASQTIHRIVDSFPASQQAQIRAQLSGSLIAVISQRLIPKIDGGLIPSLEIMTNTPAVSNLIRENKIHEIPLVIETSMDLGMISQNRYLANLVNKKEIDLKTAQMYSQNPNELMNMISIQNRNK